VTVELAPDATNPAIRIDQGHLTQVMLNLVSNARDAISARGSVSISSAIIARELARGLFRVPENNTSEYVRIAVSDDGCGMDQATLARVFEPFFTTKAAGKGAGLGLAAVHGIVKQNDGELNLVSVSQQGTTVELYFPRVANAAERRRAPVELASVRGGSEVVLVVDDEPAIRALCSRALAKLGYTVMQVESPSEALRFVSSYSGTIDLVLSDVAMPEMSGVLLCRQLTDARPKLRTLLMSGYVDSELHSDVGASQVLAKPFTQADLARRVRDVLDTEP
jgi:CheY-like chemotaxis protein